MNIIIINGSPRENGATASILHMIEEKLLLYKDVNVEFVNLSDLNIKSCSGCCSCYKTGKCYINDNAESLSNKIACADGVILGSPTYASNVSGLLKNFIDRGHFVIEQLLNNKYAISVSTGENYGSRDTSKIINQLLQYSGASLTGKIVYNTPFNSKVNNERLDKKISKMSKSLYLGIKHKKKYIVQDIKHKVIFNFGIKSFVKEKGDKYQGVIKKWEAMDITV